MIFRFTAMLLPQLLLLLSPYLVWGVSTSGNDDYYQEGEGETTELSWYDNDQMNELLMNVGSKCFAEDPSLMKIVNNMVGSDEVQTTEVVPMFLDILEDYCDEKDTSQFENALRKFQKCSQIDLEAIYETFADSIMGASLMCARYAIEVAPSIMLSYYGMMSGDMYPFPRIPEQCVDAFMGNNPLGNMLRNTLEHPGLDAKCYKELSQNVPACTLKKWPIPIPGTIVRVSSCVNSEVVPQLEDSCDVQFDILDSCLDDPRILQGVKQDDRTCAKWIQNCVASGSTFIGMPAPLNALPLSDVCQGRTEIHSKSAKLFQGFQKSCVTVDDMKYWSEGEGKMSLSSLKQFSSSDGKSAGTGGVFFGGLLTGMAAIGAGLVAKKKMDERKSFERLGQGDLMLNRNVELA